MLRPLIVALLLALVLGAGGAGARTGGGAEEAYVAVTGEDVVVSVMLDTGEVTSRIAVPRGPREVAIGSQRRFLLVSSPPAGKVTLIDSFQHRVVEMFGGFGSPRGIEIVGRYAYVADAARGEIVVLDLEKRKRVGRVAVGPRPQHLAIGDAGWSATALDIPSSRFSTCLVRPSRGSWASCRLAAPRATSRGNRTARTRT